jgi:hypothetical protein
MQTERFYQVKDITDFLNAIGDASVALDFYRDNIHENYLSEADVKSWFIWRYSQNPEFKGTTVPERKFTFMQTHVPAYSRTHIGT